MKKLSYLEKKILITIAETHVNSFEECEKIYRKIKSIDKLIKILSCSSAYGVAPSYVLNIKMRNKKCSHKHKRL